MRVLTLFLVSCFSVAAHGGVQTLHPKVDLLDKDGQPILASGNPISEEKSCGGACHDVGFISQRSSHQAPQIQASCFDCHADNLAVNETVDAVSGGQAPPADSVTIRAANAGDCAKCHGIIHVGSEPLTLPSDLTSSWSSPDSKAPWRYDRTGRTGEIISGQRVKDTHLNLAGKAETTTPLDAHASRGVGCTNCHFAPNNPRMRGRGKPALAHLKQDPRSLPYQDYFKRPDHHLSVAACEDCHAPLEVHQQLPYKVRHLEQLACQSCHIPRVYGPAVRSIDETVATAEGRARLEYRGIEDGQPPTGGAYLQGYQPFLFPKNENGRRDRIAPFNLVTRFRWVNNENGRPVDPQIVRDVFTIGNNYRREIIELLDQDADGSLSDHELVLDTESKVAYVKEALTRRGVAAPQIDSSVSAYEVVHGIQGAATTRAACDDCHSSPSRLNDSVLLSASSPFGIDTVFAAQQPIDLRQDISLASAGAEDLTLTRSPLLGDLYIFGHGRHNWIDHWGFLLFALAVLGISVHGGIRFRMRRQRPMQRRPREKVYLYHGYERVWHWSMVVTTLLLMVTGLRIHFTEFPAPFGFEAAVYAHNFVAIAFVLNAFLALFYHVATKEISKFVPAKQGLVPGLLAQVRFYTVGIFKGENHPEHKTLEEKFNPLQRLTYLGLLNVLFPLQVVSGALIWAVSSSPAISGALGGLAFVGPLHHAGSWLFLIFLVVHLYLTTTGHSLTSNISAMLDGYDEIEQRPSAVGAKPQGDEA